MSLLEGTAEHFVLEDHVLGQSFPHLPQRGLQVLLRHKFSLDVLFEGDHHCLSADQADFSASVVLRVCSHELAELLHAFPFHAFYVKWWLLER